MAIMGQVFSAVVDVMKVPINFEGHTFTLWGIFLFSGIASIAIAVLYKIWGD